MADNGDSLKGSVQETGDRQVSELALHRQPSGTDAEIPPVTKKLAEFITALLVLLYNSLRRFRALVRTTARTVLQYMQTPPVDIEGRDKMKRDGEQIKVNLKEICHEESKLREKFGNFTYHPTIGLIKWEWDLILQRDRLARCGVDIHILRGLVTKLESEAHTAVKWTISEVITGLLPASAVFGHCFYWDSVPGVWEYGSLILMLIFLVRKAQEHYIIDQMLREANRVKRELEESRCRYMKSKITLEETFPSLKEMVDKFYGGSSSPKIKSE